MRSYDEYGVKRGPHVVSMFVFVVSVLVLLVLLAFVTAKAVSEMKAKLEAQAALAAEVAARPQVLVPAPPAPALQCECVPSIVYEPTGQGGEAHAACPEQAATAQWTEHAAKEWRLSETDLR
jgi:hypothetical protein